MAKMARRLRMAELFTCFQPSFAKLVPMGNRPDDPKKHKPRRRRRHDDLLTIWLAYLNQLDNPGRRRATQFRQKHRPRREIAVTRGPRLRSPAPRRANLN
jgi:hypothetical protein